MILIVSYFVGLGRVKDEKEDHRELGAWRENEGKCVGATRKNKVKESKHKIRVERMSQMWKSIDRESYEKKYEGLNWKGKRTVREVKIKKI